MYNLFIAYLLWFLSGFGALGFHRFYLGKIPTGFLWMFTGGLFVVGSIYDFFTLPGQVREANIRDALYGRGVWWNPAPGKTTYTSRGNASSSGNWRYAEDAQARVVNNRGNEKEKPERAILKLAKEHHGILTVSEVALSANIPIEQAKKHLETLVSKGFAELRVRKSGSIVYVIPDMVDKDVPLEDF